MGKGDEHKSLGLPLPQIPVQISGKNSGGSGGHFWQNPKEMLMEIIRS